MKWPHLVQVLEVYSSLTSITVAPRFKPWNLRVWVRSGVPRVELGEVVEGAIDFDIRAHIRNFPHVVQKDT